MKKFSILKTGIAGILAAATILSFTSCKDTSFVISAGEDTIPAGVYLGYLVDSYYMAAQQATDQNKDLFDQKIGDVKAADYIKASAIASSKNHIAVNRLFDEYKLSFTDKELEEIKASIDSTWSSVSALYEENGCGKVSFEKIMMVDEKFDKIFEYYYGENGKEPVSEKDRKDFFTKNYAKIKYVNVLYSSHYDKVSTSSDASDKQKKELKELAEKYLKRLQDGESIDKLIDEEAHAAGEEHEHKEGEEAKEAEATFVQKDTSDEPADFNKKLFETKTNTPTIIENSTYGYYVLVRYDIDANGKDYTDRVDTVLSAMKSEDFKKIVEKAATDLKITENNSAIKRYKPQNVVIGY
ncbi:MAG: hypothetical protein IIX89_01025 [Oscillospiraceae bacterium]|nr:hypothetical protein [Oscillospiraceae bacterium]